MAAGRSKREVAEYGRGYDAGKRAGKHESKLSIDPTKTEKFLLVQLHEKTTALFHKIHSLETKVEECTKTIKTANLLWLKVLESSTSRDDAAAAVAVERAERIQQFKKDQQ